MPVKNALVQAEDLYDLQAVGGSRISPDGQWIIYTVQRVDRKTEKKYRNLWIVSTKSGAARQFTTGDHNDSNPVWSPDSQTIVFQSNRAAPEKPPVLFTISMTGGEATKLCEISGETGAIRWSPDGKKLLLQVRKFDADALERMENEQKKKLGVVERHIDRLYFKLDGYGYLPKERWHLWTVNVANGKATQITAHPVLDEESPAWSPDGLQIGFISNRSDKPDATPELDDIYIMPAAGGNMLKLPTPVGPKHAMSFSPDGKWIAYYGHDNPGDWSENLSLWIVATDGNTPARNLLTGYDIHVDASTINDLTTPVTMPPTWSPDSEWITFQSPVHGNTVLYRVRVADSKLETIIGDTGAVLEFTIDDKAEQIGILFGDNYDPGQVWVHSLKTGKRKQLSKHNRNLLGKKSLAKVEEVWIKGPDDNDLQGWVMTPPDFDASKSYPAIVEIHGGPLTQYGNLLMHEFQLLAANGFVVTYCNPRGGRGYGQKHASAISGSWGSVDYDDVMAWSDYVAALPYVDEKRMGVIGGSYGGYMTVWIIGHTDRFAAAVPTRCVSNFVSMWGSSDFNWSFQRVIGNKAPFEDLQNAWDRSPMKYIGNAKTPTLVMHNENDHRCPIEQGEQVFVALQRLGVESEFVRFPDEFHGLSRTGRTDRRIARLNHILRWFKRFLM